MQTQSRKSLFKGRLNLNRRNQQNPVSASGILINQVFLLMHLASSFDLVLSKPPHCKCFFFWVVIHWVLVCPLTVQIHYVRRKSDYKLCLVVRMCLAIHGSAYLNCFLLMQHGSNQDTQLLLKMYLAYRLSLASVCSVTGIGGLLRVIVCLLIPCLCSLAQRAMKTLFSQVFLHPRQG